MQGTADSGLIPSLEVQREQQLWRERTLRGVALSSFVSCAAVALWYALLHNPGRQLLPVVLGATLVFGLLALSSPVPYTVRAALLLAALYVPCAVAMRLSGFAPNPFLGFGAVCVIGALLLGRRVGLALVLVSAVTIGAIAFAHRTGHFERIHDWEQNLDSANPRTALRVVFIFSFLTTTLVIAVSYLLRRAEQLLVEKSRSLTTLRREELERERIARDLELREAAFHKARELELLGRLAGSMAHDFNNALLVIWAELDEIARFPALPGSVLESLAGLRAAADQASSTTRQLRAFGPMAPRRPSELALGPVLQKAKTMFSRVLPPNIELSADVQFDAWIVADEGEVLRVLMNLALNARDAMRDGGSLTLRVRRLGPRETPLPVPTRSPRAPDAPPSTGSIVLEVEDTGSGMSEAVKSRVFEPFFTTKQAAGTGLGLASVRDVVVAHGGRVDVTSELEVGTTISLVWPAIAHPLPRTHPPLVSHRMDPIVVLLVDDHAAVRVALCKTLARAGMTVLEAVDGADALTTARRHAGPIDVLCTDCVMPGPSVRELIAAFRARSPGRVLVCSGYAPADSGLTPEVFDDFLPKPFSGERLVERIHAVLRQDTTQARPHEHSL